MMRVAFHEKAFQYSGSPTVCQFLQSYVSNFLHYV